VKIHLARTALTTALLISSSIAQAGNTTNHEIALTYARHYVSLAQDAKAREVLTRHLQTDAQDADAWNLFGLILQKAGDLPGATQAFRNAARYATSSASGPGPIYYNLAEAEARGGRIGEARQALAQAQQDPAVTAAARKALQSLRPGQGLPPLELADTDSTSSRPLTLRTSAWQLALQAGGGYDSNVLLYSDSSLAGVSASNYASPFASLSARATHLAAIGWGKLTSRAVSRYTYETNTSAQTYNTLQSAASSDWQGDRGAGRRWIPRLGVQGDHTLLNTSGLQLYTWAATLNPGVTRTLGATSELELLAPVYFRHYRLETDADVDNERSGAGARPSLLFRKAWSDIAITLGVEYERIFAKGINFRSTTWRAPLVLSLPTFLKTRPYFGAEGANIRYPESTSAREDRYLRLSLGTSIRFSARLEGTLDYSAVRNSSTDGSATYSKHTVSWMMNYEAF